MTLDKQELENILKFLKEYKLEQVVVEQTTNGIGLTTLVSDTSETVQENVTSYDNW